MRARRAALDTLRAVRERDAYANLVLPGLLRSRGITGPDAARATDLTYGTLRARGTYDRIIAACSSRRLDQVDPAVLDALRLGVHQLMGERVPPHAAVSTTVELTRRTAGGGAARFANAVLRCAAEHPIERWVERLLPPDADAHDRLALAHYHPRWVVDAFADALGDQAHRLAAVLAADNAPPRVTLAALPGRADVAELVAQGAAAGRWTSTAATAPAGDPMQLEAVRSGRARVQDEGSQLVTHALAAAPVEEPEQPLWLDMCAGPGGKAALLAALAQRRRARVLAADVHEHRAQLVRQALAHSGLGSASAVVVADGTRAPWTAETFSRVLLDAPCTGLGALRRRPESRWRRRPEDLDRLVPLQQALLNRALDSTRPGAVAAYVTCSPHSAETVDVVESVTGGRRDVTILDAPRLAPSLPDAARGRYLQLWPDLHGTDAMFLALLRRTPRV